MKRIIIAMILTIIVVISLSAQTGKSNFYFDIGFGVGGGTTKVDGKDVADVFDKEAADVFVGLAKVGIRLPSSSMPIYLTFELSGTGNSYTVNKIDNMLVMCGTVQYNSYLLAPGVVVYPSPLFQLSVSLGYAYDAIATNVNMMDTNTGGGGFGMGASAAIDLGKRRHGVLFGINYHMASTEKIDTSYFGGFVKYVFREK